MTNDGELAQLRDDWNHLDEPERKAVRAMVKDLADMERAGMGRAHAARFVGFVQAAERTGNGRAIMAARKVAKMH